MSLIFWINRKTVYKDKKVGTKPYCYVVHVFALSLVSCSQIILSFGSLADLAISDMLYNSTYSITLVLICVIVWSQATVRQNKKIYLYHYDDGRVELKVENDETIQRSVSISDSEASGEKFTASFQESIQSASSRRPTILRELQRSSSVIARQQCHAIVTQFIHVDDEDYNPEAYGLPSFNRQEQLEEVSSLLHFSQKLDELEKRSRFNNGE